MCACVVARGDARDGGEERGGSEGGRSTVKKKACHSPVPVSVAPPPTATARAQGRATATPLTPAHAHARPLHVHPGSVARRRAGRARRPRAAVPSGGAGRGEASLGGLGAGGRRGVGRGEEEGGGSRPGRRAPIAGSARPPPAPAAAHPARSHPSKRAHIHTRHSQLPSPPPPPLPLLFAGVSDPRPQSRRLHLPRRPHRPAAEGGRDAPRVLSGERGEERKGEGGGREFTFSPVIDQVPPRPNLTPLRSFPFPPPPPGRQIQHPGRALGGRRLPGRPPHPVRGADAVHGRQAAARAGGPLGAGGHPVPGVLERAVRK